MPYFTVTPVRTFSAGEQVSLSCLRIKASTKEEAEHKARKDSHYGHFEGWNFISKGIEPRGMRRNLRTS